MEGGERRVGWRGGLRKFGGVWCRGCGGLKGFDGREGERRSGGRGGGGEMVESLLNEGGVSGRLRG